MTLRSRRFPPDLRNSATHTQRSIAVRVRSSRCWNGSPVRSAQASAMRRGRHTIARRAVNYRGCSLRAGARPSAPRRAAEHLLQLVGLRDLELIVATILRAFVGTPAHEDRCVPEAVA